MRAITKSFAGISGTGGVVRPPATCWPFAGCANPGRMRGEMEVEMMNTAEITTEQIVNLARHLKPCDIARLISRLAAMMGSLLDENSAQPDLQRESFNGTSIESGSAPSVKNIDGGVFTPSDDRALAEATASIETAWRESGLTTADILKVTDEIRQEIAQREFGHLLGNKP
ncbi:MAG: hypothetical protein ACREEM_35500 [Blastocatellia bacterium]